MSFDVKDFPVLDRQWAERGQLHAGIVLSVLLPYGELLRRLLALLDARSAEDLVNRVEWLHDAW